jgi:hypothetical protein
MEFLAFTVKLWYSPPVIVPLSLSSWKAVKRNFLLYGILIYCHPWCTPTNCGKHTVSLYWMLTLRVSVCVHTHTHICQLFIGVSLSFSSCCQCVKMDFRIRQFVGIMVPLWLPYSGWVNLGVIQQPLLMITVCSSICWHCGSLSGPRFAYTEEGSYHVCQIFWKPHSSVWPSS